MAAVVLVAVELPILTALLGIGAGLSVIGLLGHIAPAPSFSPVIAAMIGLGVGVDYALFVVTRFREGLHAGREPEDAAVTAMRTAGRTVLIAGSTVVIGMMGLLVLRQPLLNGVAVAAAATVAMVLLGSLTLLPALLGFSGTRLAKRSRLLFWRRNRSTTADRPGKIPAAERGRARSAGAGLAERGRARGAGAGLAERGRPRSAGAGLAERWAGVIQRRPVL